MAFLSKDMPLIKAVEKHAVPIDDINTAYDTILEASQDKEVVLIGEATHGTHEFYHIRAEITKRLISEQGFDAVAVEADWPDAYHINNFVSGQKASTAKEALAHFQRFPLWMWNNHDVCQFIEWLQAYNQQQSPPYYVGFYGLDLYNLRASIDAVITYLQEIDSEAAKRAKKRYACLDHFIDSPENYGDESYQTIADKCEASILKQLIELNNNAYDYIQHQSINEEDAFFLC